MRSETLLKAGETKNAMMNDTLEKEAQRRRRRCQYRLEILREKEGKRRSRAAESGTQKTVSKMGKTRKNRKIEKEEAEDKVAISCARGKREFKQNMKKELFA